TIVSDENIPGHCGHCVKTGSLYRFRGELLATFARSLQLDVAEVHLGIRSYDAFFAAAYVEFLRSVNSHRYSPVDQMTSRVLEKMPSWEQVIEAFGNAFPKARIFVWRHEDFARIEPLVVSNLVGQNVDPAKLRKPKLDNKRPTASAPAVHELLHQIERDGADAAVERWKDIQAAHPRAPGDPPFSPWTDEEARHLQHIYAKDTAELWARGDITAISPT
ncbi:MAG: hypothetical protein HRU32_16395, partial [Rhodobacteraceae bacterium]|nr:hypothetical protein [Paracoccaceae bacterium]